MVRNRFVWVMFFIVICVFSYSNGQSLRLDVPWGMKVIYNVDTTSFENIRMNVVLDTLTKGMVVYKIDTSRVMAFKVDTVADTIKPFAITPSVGFDFFIRESQSGSYKMGIIPGVGYGLKWDPGWWKTTKYFLSLDLFVQGLLSNELESHDGNDYFDVDVLPVITVIDWFGVGFGSRFKIGLENVPSKQRWIFSFGIRKATS